VIRISKWSGIVTAASPYILPAGGAVEQINAQSLIPGQLTVRGGMGDVEVAGVQAASLTAGTVVTVRLTMSQVSIVTGTPLFTITVNGVARSAPYSSGSGTNTLLFTYTLVAGDISPGGGSILDGSNAPTSIVGNKVAAGSGGMGGRLLELWGYSVGSGQSDSIFGFNDAGNIVKFTSPTVT
jgi:hypothetical protein